MMYNSPSLTAYVIKNHGFRAWIPHVVALLSHSSEVQENFRTTRDLPDYQLGVLLNEGKSLTLGMLQPWVVLSRS